VIRDTSQSLAITSRSWESGRQALFSSSVGREPRPAADSRDEVREAASVRDSGASRSAVDQDVLGLDVAMDDAFIMSKLQSITQLADNGQGIPGIQLADRLGLNRLSQSHSVDEFHQKKIDSLTLPEFVDRYLLALLRG